MKVVSYSRWSFNDSRRVVSEEWSLKPGCLLIQVVSNTGLTVHIFREKWCFTSIFSFLFSFLKTNPSIQPCLNPFPNDKLLYSSKLKEFADNNFGFDENGRKLSKRLENTEGKGEIACYE